MRNVITLLAVGVLACPVAGWAQAWNTDARTVGIGGIGGDQNIFATSVAEERGDRSFVLPLGLFQTLRNIDTFKPSSPDFDPARLVEFANNPMYVQFGRTRSSAGALFVYGVRNAGLSRDLNDYRGFVPSAMTASGVIAPSWGRTFRVKESDHGLNHSIYAGAGPHLSLRTKLDVDPALVETLSSLSPSYVANHRFTIDNQSTAQLAMALTGGYRGRFPISARKQDAALFSANVNYLHGFRYEDVDLDLRLDTDGAGRLVSGQSIPVSLVRNTALKGRGMSLDLGAGLMLGRWEVGVSGNNLAHRMTWRNGSQRTYTLTDLFSGTPNFEKTAPIPATDVNTRLPGHYRGNLAFTGEWLSLRGEVAHDGHDASFRGGVEHARQRIQMRAAAALANHTWNPTAGLSVALGRRLWIDLAGFTTSANVERQRRYAVATSLRIASRTPRIGSRLGTASSSGTDGSVVPSSAAR